MGSSSGTCCAVLVPTVVSQLSMYCAACHDVIPSYSCDVPRDVFMQTFVVATSG